MQYATAVMELGKSGQQRHAAVSEVLIKAGPLQVWKGLCHSALVKHYLPGADGGTWAASPAFYSGSTWGRGFQEKGAVLDLTPFKSLRLSYWNSATNLPDLPENYHTITYTLSLEYGLTRLHVSQEGLGSLRDCQLCQHGWDASLWAMKAMLEGEDVE